MLLPIHSVRLGNFCPKVIFPKTDTVYYDYALRHTLFWIEHKYTHLSYMHHSAVYKIICQDDETSQIQSSVIPD